MTKAQGSSHETAGYDETHLSSVLICSEACEASWKRAADRLGDNREGAESIEGRGEQMKM